MIFNKQSRRILSEWVLDFEHSPLGGPQNPDLLTALKHAAKKGDCKTTFVSLIATLSATNEKLSHLDGGAEIALEAKLILKNIKQYFTVEIHNNFVTVGKK